MATCFWETKEFCDVSIKSGHQNNDGNLREELTNDSESKGQDKINSRLDRSKNENGLLIL